MHVTSCHARPQAGLYESAASRIAGVVQTTGKEATIARYQSQAGFAFTNNNNALVDADQVVKGLGMEYMQIPVSFDNPLPDDFYAFAESMELDIEKKTLLHCQVNARATAFSFLYRVIYHDVPVAEAKADMNTVWQPNAVWRDFIFEILEENEVDQNCAGCDWTPPPPRQ